MSKDRDNQDRNNPGHNPNKQPGHNPDRDNQGRNKPGMNEDSDRNSKKDKYGDDNR